MLHQTELTGGQFYSLVFTAQRTRQSIQPPGSHPQAMRQAVAAGAPQQGLQPRVQFFDVEGFGQIVIGAELEPGDPVLQLVARGQQNHRRADAGRAQSPQDRQAVASRQADIQHQGVKTALACPLEAQMALRAVGHLRPALAEPGDDQLGNARLVLDQQHIQGRHSVGSLQ